MNRRKFLKYAGTSAAVVGVSALGWITSSPRFVPTHTTSSTAFSSGSCTTTSTSAAVTSQISIRELRAAAERSGLLVGAAAFPFSQSFDNGHYGNVLGAEFNFLTPENAMKWEYVDGQGYGPADDLVSFASDHEMKGKGHTLVWHRQLPEQISAQMSADDLRMAMQKHIREEVGHFKGKVYAWDVVNEAIDDRNGLRHTIFLDKLGEGYIAEAFRLAHETDPDALLIYNEYGAEGLGDKSERVYDLVRKLLNDGVPIHGVGLQMHISATSYPKPEDISANVRRLVALGLKVNISEMDVRIKDVPGTPAEKLEVQRQVYHDVIAACVEEKGFMGVTLWGFTDAHSWVYDFFGGPDAPLLFDENYEPKPAYWGVLDALQGK